jgi:hypothetical protein
MRTAISILAILTLALGIMGCQSSQERVERSIANKLPENATIVAASYVPNAPLLFIADSDGRLIFFSNSQLVAQFPIKAGQRVQLNDWDSRTPGTRLMLDGDVVYESSTRFHQSRLYFVPDNQ